MLVPYPAIQGPLPKILPLLVEALRRLGCVVETECWSRHSDHESLLEKTLSRAGDLRRIRTRLRARQFDLLFITTAHTPAALSRDIPLVLATRRTCPHRVIQFHGSSSAQLSSHGHTLLRWASRLLVGRCDAVLVLSEQERREWASFCPDGRFEVVANPFVPASGGTGFEGLVNGSGQPQAPPRPRYRSGVPTILFVGRLMAEKGILDLIRAVAELNRSTPCRLLVAGDGPSASDASDLAGRLGIGDRVALLGYASGPGLTLCYREADVFALPTYYAEGFPTVILEAMSAGLPVVTTAHRGAADRLEEGINALFVPPRHPAALADALGRVLNDDSLRAAMAASNLGKVQEFAPEVVAPRYFAILESVVGMWPSGRRPAMRAAS